MGKRNLETEEKNKEIFFYCLKGSKETSRKKLIIG